MEAGNAYHGQIKDGLFHGRGTLIYQGNEKYEGEFVFGKREGQGTFSYADGAVFEGQWVDDRIHGHGTALFASGNRYEGQWENGRINGEGKLTYQNGDEYEGDWVDGKMHGRGTYRYAEGDVYHGEWRDDKRHGKGTVTYVSAKGNVVEKYEGDWVNGKMHGHGKMVESSGDLHTGVFYQNWMKDHKGKWRNFLKAEHEAEKRGMMHLGARLTPDALLPVSVASGPNELLDSLMGSYQANQIPFVISSDTDAALTALHEATGEEPLPVHMKYAAKMKARLHDWKGLFRKSITAALEEARPLAIVFDAYDPSEPLPAEWSVKEFWGEAGGLPCELFDPNKFHGRGLSEQFGNAVADREGENKADETAAEEPTEAKEPQEASGEEAPPPPSAEGFPVCHRLQFVVIGVHDVSPASLADGGALRGSVALRFGMHVPLHRCSLVALTML
mmetsp:Transcript_18526/g.52912  ORF Transcript_18526/g.52912 Transcript_18526/m.52912 type:complete len:445 (-) Transcript_18526:3305-4639(-)